MKDIELLYNTITKKSSKIKIDYGKTQKIFIINE